MEKTYCLYDEEYFGPGYLIISEQDNTIFRFMKLSVINNYGFPHFVIRGYEKDSYDKPDEDFRKIKIAVTKEENADLFSCIQAFSSSLNGKKVMSIDPSSQGKNYLTSTVTDTEASIELFKDVYGVASPSDAINIDLGDNYSCECYDAIHDFYNSLGVVNQMPATTEVIKGLLKAQK